ncbi:hypothetical protein CJF30_00004337 [Rutstroemia sp. NJR-2017a BBW]|nr:hypothetical protein CJF30_00004337 [Rutstroemia sp. NJR-2017a BBW]
MHLRTQVREGWCGIPAESRNGKSAGLSRRGGRSGYT